MLYLYYISSVNADVLGKPVAWETETVSNFDKIDELYESQVNALMEEKWQEYEDISNSLQNMECEEITYGELLNLTDSNAKKNMIATYGTSLSNISFSKTTSTVNYNGKKYKIMKVTAIPKGEGYLYQTGVTTQTNKNKVKAGSLSLINSAVSGIPNKVGLAVSVYNALRGVVNSISSTTEVKQIKASYTWAVAETVNFIYVYDNNSKHHALAARYNKVQHNVAVNIPILKCSNGTFNSKIKQQSYSNTKMSSNYGNTTKAISYFNSGKVYSPYLTRIKLNGVSGTIKSISLNNPESAGHMGYGW